MPVGTDISRFALSVAIAAAIVLFLVPPLCGVLGCGVPLGTMHDMHMTGAPTAECGLGAAGSPSVAGVAPPKLDGTFLVGAMLLAAIAGLTLTSAPRRAALVKARSGAPPPDPLGVRLLI